MHEFGWLSERGGNFFNLLQKEGGTQKRGGPSEKGGGSNPGGNYGWDSSFFYFNIQAFAAFSLSKEDYCYKIHTLLMKSKAHPHLP